MSTLICFALKEAAAPFRKIAAGKGGISILPAGFNADLKLGEVIFEILDDNLRAKLLAAGGFVA